MAQLRRENERLDRRLAQLEERSRLMGDGAQPAARTKSKSSRRRRAGSGVPYDLPVVQLNPKGTGPVRTTDSVSIGEVPNSGIDLDGPQDDHARGYGSDSSAYEASAAAPEPVRAPAPAPSSAQAGDDVQSYRLVGNRLVRATKAPPKQKQTRSPKPSRSKRSKRSSSKDPALAEYEAAMSIYKAGRFREAELAFDGIVRRFASHEYADNALYWRGESAYDQQHYADALAAFTSVVERYGGGNKAPDALLKIGLCYGKLGDAANARDVLTQLIAAYPRARAARLAKTRLDDFSADGAAN